MNDKLGFIGAWRIEAIVYAIMAGYDIKIKERDNSQVVLNNCRSSKNHRLLMTYNDALK